MSDMEHAATLRYKMIRLLAAARAAAMVARATAAERERCETMIREAAQRLKVPVAVARATMAEMLIEDLMKDQVS